MASLKKIHPTGKLPLQPGQTKDGKKDLRDVDVIQEALDDQSVETLELQGTFLLGPQETLYLSRNLTIKGARKATISGGSWLRWGFRRDQVSPTGIPVPISATIENVTFEGFTGGGIRIGGATGSNRILGCEFRNYHKGPSSSGSLQGAWPIVASPENASGKSVSSFDPGALTGTLEIRGCRFGPPLLDQTPSGSVGMNNLVHVNNCHLDVLQIYGNVIEDMCWFGFAVWGVTGKTEIVNNQITLTQKSAYLTTAGGFRPGAGIAFGLRPTSYAMTPDGALRIEGNTINIGSTGSYGIVVGRYGDAEYSPLGSTVAHREILVRDNNIHMTLAANADNAGLACCGGCEDATFKLNVVTGSAPYGIRVSPQLPLDSVMKQPTAHPIKSTFIGNKLVSFTAGRAQALIDEAVTGTNLESNVFGPVSGSNGLDWLTRPCAGVVVFGDKGLLVRNDFSGSAIPGWHRGAPAEPVLEEHFGTLPTPVPQAFVDPGIGCIYLAETSDANVVEYEPADFPPGTVPPAAHQILDVFHSGWASKVKKMWMQDNKVVEPQPI